MLVLLLFWNSSILFRELSTNEKTNNKFQRIHSNNEEKNCKIPNMSLKLRVIKKKKKIIRLILFTLNRTWMLNFQSIQSSVMWLTQLEERECLQSSYFGIELLNNYPKDYKWIYSPLIWKESFISYDNLAQTRVFGNHLDDLH